MFRYVAIAWDSAASTTVLAANELCQAMRMRPGWSTALAQPGLEVLTIGSKPGINSATVLPEARGIVLGRLLRRADLGSSATRVTPTGEESTKILTSGGRSLVNDYWGRYVAFFQAASGAVSVLRDPTGTLPCFFVKHQGLTVVFSRLEDALHLLRGFVSFAVNWNVLTAQLRWGETVGRETALHGVSQVHPGELLDLNTGTSTLLWSAIAFAQDPATSNPEDAMRVLRQTVRSCTQAWASCYGTLLLRLSGGVDSSILLSCLSPADTLADVICINYHSPGSDSDERVYARLAAARTGRDLLERVRNVNYRIERIFETARTPFPIPYIGWMNASTDAALASAHGASALFTGAGGDSLFFEFPRWWPAADYLRAKGLDAGFPTAALDAARLGKISVWRAMALALRDRVWPSLAARNLIVPTPLLTTESLQNRRRRHPILHPTLPHLESLSIGKYMQALALAHPIGYYDPFEQSAAPEIVNPLLSQPLVELCLRLPSYVLTRGGQGRALARQAFAEDLPPCIANRRSKGGMEEHIKAVLDHNLGFVRNLLLDGRLVQRHLVDRSKVEALLSGRPTAMAGPLTQIHALVAVEAWLTRWTH
ncbi:asparagine synthase-related protein [Roseateles sp. NT4]|uniref:asparagine synthase-related protein n=1 Tax=Roseateles sp. NT4 TaxID=3453715 RepID=UPI003EEA4BA0